MTEEEKMQVEQGLEWFLIEPYTKFQQVEYHDVSFDPNDLDHIGTQAPPGEYTIKVSAGGKELTGKDNLSDKEITHHAYQLYVKEYLRCVKGIDDNLQRIFDYLKENDLMSNTIVIYTSDQGQLQL